VERKRGAVIASGKRSALDSEKPVERGAAGVPRFRKKIAF
jgi:hypothetical protein